MSSAELAQRVVKVRRFKTHNNEQCLKRIACWVKNSEDDFFLKCCSNSYQKRGFDMSCKCILFVGDTIRNTSSVFYRLLNMQMRAKG